MNQRPHRLSSILWLLLAAACSSSPPPDAPDGSKDGGAGRDGPRESGSSDGMPPAMDGSDTDTATAPAPVPWAPSCSSLCPIFVDAIDLEAVSLALDRTRKRLYATINGVRGAISPGLAVIDPLNRRVIGTLAVGGLSRALAIADDDSSLWIAVDEANALRRLDLTTDPPQLGPLLPLPVEGSPQDPRTTIIGSMLVAPGRPRTVVASLRYDHVTGGPGVRLFEDGVVRAMLTPGQCSSDYLVPGPPGYLFGYGGGFGELCVLRVSDGGLEATHVDRMLQFPTFETSYTEGRLYNRAGEVFDASNPDQVMRLPRFPVKGPLLPQPGRRVLMISVGSDLPANSPSGLLRVLDGNTSPEVESMAIPTFVSNVSNLIQLDDDKLVMIDGFSNRTAWRILFLQHALIRRPP
jgi:hypothetical protein